MSARVTNFWAHSHDFTTSEAGVHSHDFGQTQQVAESLLTSWIRTINWHLLWKNRQLRPSGFILLNRIFQVVSPNEGYWPPRSTTFWVLRQFIQYSLNISKCDKSGYVSIYFYFLQSQIQKNEKLWSNSWLLWREVRKSTLSTGHNFF